MRVLIASLILWTGTAIGGHAACYADYKAKKDNPLKLHYGVVQVSDGDCRSTSATKSAVTKKLSSAGWTLLSVLGTFDESGLDKRRGEAGQYFLRF